MIFLYEYQNNAGRQIFLAIEPWGGGFYLQPDGVAHLKVNAPGPGNLIIEQHDDAACSLWFWRGCTVEASIEGQDSEHYSYDIESPG